jgi:hypothetical protein
MFRLQICQPYCIVRPYIGLTILPADRRYVTLHRCNQLKLMHFENRM